MVNNLIEDYLENRKGGHGSQSKTPTKPKVALNNAGKSPSLVKTENVFNGNTASVTGDKRCVVTSVSFFVSICEYNSHGPQWTTDIL